MPPPKLKEKLDEARNELAIVPSAGPVPACGRAEAYGVIPELGAQARRRGRRKGGDNNASSMVEETVTPDHVAHVVSRWTGIPVDKMLEGEREKLLRMEDEMGERVVGQGEAVQAVSKAVRRARGQAFRIPTGRSARSSSSVRPASARPS